MTARTSVAKVEVHGQALMAIFAALSLIQKRAMKILAEHGIPSIEKEKWYPMERILGVVQAIHHEIGPNTLKNLGRKIPEHAPQAPGVQVLEEALGAVKVTYAMSHRGSGNIGGYRYESTGERKGRMVCDNPYPCELDEGLLEALGEKFRPQDSVWVRVEHQAGSCRKNGASTCTYNISW